MLRVLRTACEKRTRRGEEGPPEVFFSTKRQNVKLFFSLSLSAVVLGILVDFVGSPRGVSLLYLPVHLTIYQYDSSSSKKRRLLKTLPYEETQSLLLRVYVHLTPLGCALPLRYVDGVCFLRRDTPRFSVYRSSF